MPRYFFNVRDHDLITDHTGIELSGPDEARRQAYELVALGRRLLPIASFRIVVTNDQDDVVFEMDVKESA